jgi:hypothetical protein
MEAALEALTGPPHDVLQLDYAGAMNASGRLPGHGHSVQPTTLGGHDVCLVPNDLLINIYDTTLTALVDWTEEPARTGTAPGSDHSRSCSHLPAARTSMRTGSLHTPQRTLLLTAPSHA